MLSAPSSPSVARRSRAAATPEGSPAAAAGGRVGGSGRRASCPSARRRSCCRLPRRHRWLVGRGQPPPLRGARRLRLVGASVVPAGGAPALRLAGGHVVGSLVAIGGSSVAGSRHP